MINARQINELQQVSVAKSGISHSFRVDLFLFVVHIPLGILIYNAGPLAVLHPAAAFAVGLYWAYQKRVPLGRVALAIAYIIGAEVLWRMAEVPVFWEFGKYGSAVIAGVALIRRRQLDLPALPLVYFLLLLPAALMTLTSVPLGDAREIFSSNLSGPFFLFVCSWFFSNVRITALQLRRILIAVLIPLISVACATLFYTVTAEEITFSLESNFATSGGFGPNQVSSVLGLGALVAAMCLLLFKNSGKYKLYFALAAVLFTAQSVMTFSRSGIYNAAAALLAIALIQLRDPGAAIKSLIPMAALAVLFLALVFPILNDFTGGNLQERFEETGTTHRGDIVESDFAIFAENPILGVGVGASYEYREKFLDFKAMSHTEFTRLISEHGIFGIAALFCLAAMAISNVWRQQTVFGKAMIAGAAVWCSMFMLNTGMRLAAPSFIWGLTFINIADRGTINKSVRRTIARTSSGSA